MRGTTRPISLSRKLIIDLMDASVPLVVVRRTLTLERLAKARATLTERPGWSTIIAKAFCIVARDEPWLRTFYLKWPVPHFYELPKSVAMLAVIREDVDKEAPIIIKIGAADEMSLDSVEAIIRASKTEPLDRVPYLHRVLRVARLPRPIRRLLWIFALNLGRQRANHFGTLSITSIASLGSETVVARAPGPNMLSYGLVRPDRTMELLLHWDHRIYDGVVAARALQRLEDVLNGEIADELLAGGALGNAPP